MTSLNHNKIIQFNCRSVYSNLSELKRLIYRNKPIVVALCETWINNSNARYPRFAEYNTEWVNRIDRLGAGLGLLISKDIQYRLVDLSL